MIKRKVITGDLLDENFTCFESYLNNEKNISGWDIDTGGGWTYDLVFSQWFELTDLGSGKGISMKKDFVPQEAGRITLEYRFRMPLKMSGASWEIRGGETAAVRIYTCKEALWYGDGSQIRIMLSKYEDDVEYGIKIDADIDSNTADIYLNGILKVSGARFLNASVKLDNILIMTGGKDRGEIFLNPVKMYKGYIIYERFLSCTPGNIPSGWTADNSGGTGCSEEFRCSAAPDFYSYRMENTVPGQQVTLTKQFSPAGGRLVFEYRFLLLSKSDGMGVLLSFGGTSTVDISTLDGCMCITCNGGEPQKIQQYIPNIWYHVRLEADLDSGSFMIYVNGKRKPGGIQNLKNIKLDTIRFHTSDEGKGVFWVDDILLYNAPDEPDDHVPEPVPVNGGEYCLGMQVCSLWREGHHLGWDLIKPYPERKPYLGWYEEGLAEVSDWEIKWMSEHGVDFQFYCWYRPVSGINNPIKNPIYDQNLHDGYFFSRYSHMLKFAIMFENGNTRCGGFDDLLNNLIPFWVEYYLKDPRYMCIDNKPVFGIYGIDGLIRDFGGTDGAKEAVRLIRQSIVEAGFDGAIMLCECRQKNIELMKSIKEIGFDCIYSYTWYTGDRHIQEECMQWQKNAEVIDLLPTISMGWNTEAWGGTDANWASPGEFEELSYRVRDELIPSMKENSPGRRIIMLDNWNEFGEGHFMMPAGLYGFGYLDALRKVFTNAPKEHEDSIPSEKQLARYDTLYPKGW